MIASIWDTLSTSSKQALRFAWAAAQQRAPDATPNTQLDSFDLLVGIMLSHPGTSEAELAFRHFDLAAGQALPSSYPALTFDGLQKRLADLPTDAMPPTTDDVDQILRAAVEIYARAPSGSESESDGITPLRALWVALLLTSNPASSAIHDLLGRRGINSKGLADASQSWLSTIDVNYEDVLAGFSATPIDIVNYKADQSTSHDATGTPTAVEDYIGLGAEVDAFAYLLASRNLSPPLAIGMFGDWGSGKSFFLDAIRRRIDQLTQIEVERKRPQAKTQFWKHVVQVEFNAWHYVEGDLWSSLVDHIFSQLNVASDNGSEDIVLKRQRYLLRQLDSTAATIKQLDDRKQSLQRDVEERQQTVTDKRNALKNAQEEAEKKRDELVRIEVLERSVAGVVGALAAVKLSGAGDQPKTLGEQAAALQTARDELNRGSALLRPYLKHPGWLIVLLAFLFGAPLIAWAIEQWSHSSTVAVLGGFVSLLAVFGGAIGAASQWVHRRLDDLSAAQVKVDAEIAGERTRLQNQVEKAEKALARASADLEQAEREHAQLSASLASIQRDLEKKPQQVLNEFLRDRLAAGDYRQRLGVPAIIRRDFRDLANLISYQNAYLTETSEKRKQEIREAADNEILEEDGEQSELIVNRIVLYIDDLDRCPDAKVIEVLQAVHMLLAFPLFVVVVAVDARWLASALQNRYPALAGGGYALEGRPARPNDYLEKIFQVPFWVSNLSDQGRGAIVRGLLGPHVRGGATAAPTHVADGDTTHAVDERAAAVLRDMVNARTGPPQLDIAALQMTAEELAFLENLTPMLGATPRSVKRFVNLYQLLKILRRARPQTQADPADERLAALLLAMSERLPELFRLIGEDSPHTLGELAGDPGLQGTNGQSDKLASERACLKQWLEQQRSGWKTVGPARLAEIATDVRRFLFQSFELHVEEAQARRPQLVHVIQER